MTEQTLILIKPDAIECGFEPNIYQRFLDDGFTIVREAIVDPSVRQITRHYRDKFAKRPDLYDDVVAYLRAGHVIAFVAERENAIARARELIGPLNRPPKEPAPEGTIRGDFPSDPLRSLVHASDSAEAAKYEINVWFGKNGNV